MREICTSGSVRDGDGNAPIYSAFDPAQGPQMGDKDSRLDEPSQLSEEVQHPGIEGRLQPFQKQPAVKPGEHSD
jgi:hypothetical protein